MRWKLISSDATSRHRVYVTATFVVKWTITPPSRASIVVELTTLFIHLGMMQTGGSL
jgi:hypothetical protein